MKQFYTLIIYTFFVLSIGNLKAQTVWTGATTTFTKANNADWTLETNQDRITDNVWITRRDVAGLFNIKVESDAGSTDSVDNLRPSDTEWAYGTTANYNTLTYQPLSALINGGFNSIVDGQDMVVHLITDNIYIDIKFTSWTNSNGGGGFAYERSTDQNLSSSEFEIDKKITVFPNPSSDFIQISGWTEKESFRIYNVIGALISKGTMLNSNKIDIRNLNSGLYVLKFDNNYTLKFLKK